MIVMGNKIINVAFFLSVVLVFIYKPMVAKAEDNCPLPIMVKVINENNDLSEQNVNLLTHKLQHLVSRGGFGGQDLAYLCLLAYVSQNDKEVISGNRPLVVMNGELHLILCNLKSGEEFNSASFKLTGTGNNDSQAFQKSFARISRQNPEINGFLTQAREKVFTYYDKHIPSITKQADLLTMRGEYEEALFMLASVPPCCNNYESVEESIIRIWDTYINRECEEQLARATAIWRSQKTREAALEAAAYIGAIKRESPCASRADELLAEIESKLDADYARQLALEDDQREFTKEQIREEMNLKKEEVNIRKMQVEAIRDVALSFSDNIVGPLLDKLPSLLK